MVLLASWPILSNAGQWLTPASVAQIEARDGSWFSVILEGTDSLCPSNRVIFRNGTWINQEGVNHHYSLILMAASTGNPVAIHVEIENGECIGRITYINP